MKPIILASGSTARRTLLEAAGVRVTVRPSEVDEALIKERLLSAGLSPRAIAGALADAKATSTPRTIGSLIIGADQTLEVDGELLDKTADLAGARARLIRLRDKPFTLHSAVSGVAEGQVVWRHNESARLAMRTFSDAFLDDYLGRNTEDLSTSLAGFALEGEGVQLFEWIDGDYFSILGLPLLPVLDWLRRAGGLPL